MGRVGETVPNLIMVPATLATAGQRSVGTSVQDERRKKSGASAETTLLASSNLKHLLAFECYVLV